MNQPTSKRKKIWKKLLSRYRLVILNEESFEEQLYFRLTRLNVIIITTFLVTLLFSLTIAFVAYTPVKEFIPGYASTKMKKQANENADRLDDLLIVYEQSQQQIRYLQQIITGKIPEDPIPDNNRLNDSLPLVQREIPSRNAEDSLLRKLVEQEDKYALTATTNKVDFVLFPPAKGNISQRFDPAIKHYAVDIVLNENDPIKAAADGTVIFAEWTADTGYVMIIKHPYGLLTSYKHNAALSKSQGESVKAGEVIATAGNTGELSTGYHLHFELWSDGYAMDPLNFIDFSLE